MRGKRARPVRSKGVGIGLSHRNLVGVLCYNMMRKGQVRGVDKADIAGQKAFIASLFSVAA